MRVHQSLEMGGTGTTIRAMVPAHPDEACPMALSAKHLPLAGCSILLVENEPVVAQSVADCLQDAGAFVLTAWHIKDALSMVERSRLSAAVLDLEFGDDDTTVVCRHLTERGVPFLFYSGYDDAYVCDKWPGATVVIKPAGEQVLIAALSELIGR
jgi:DNA-binding response OmpR family regulator